MNFRNIIRIAEDETSIPENWYLKTILNNIIEKANSEVHENSSLINDAIADTKKDISEYIDKKANTSIKTKTIEYYIGRRSYSHSSYNIARAYKDIYKEILQENRDILEDDKDIQYTYNLDENMKLLVAGIISKIKQDRSKINKFFNSHDTFSNYYSTTKKTKERLIRTVTQGDKKTQDAYKKLFALCDKSDKEILENEVKNYTKKASDSLKGECISSIRNNIVLLDKYGIMDNMIEANNAVNRNIYLFNCDYNYEETMELFSEKNLKDLSAEQLIGMTAYWDNRTAKVITEMNKAVYILSHPELYKTSTDENGKVSIDVSDETLKNIHLKMNILQKVCFEIFDEAEWNIKDEKASLEEENEESREFEEAGNGVRDISFEVDEICDKYEDEYRNFLDTKLSGSKNDLKEDALESLEFENFIYNLYATKGANIQALLISAINSGVDCIQNYGYIEEKNKKDGFMLIGIDIPGMNMPLRLHTLESNVLDVVEGNLGENAELPKYIGSKDFYYSGNNKIIPAQLFIPVSKEKAKSFKKEADKVNEKDKYGNTVKHIAYVALKGKMPEHMVNEKNREAEIEK